MKLTLQFHSDRPPSMLLEAESDAEKTILAYLAEDSRQRWLCHPSYSYRPGGLERVQLVVAVPTENHS